MKKFFIGAIAGAVALTVAVPLLAQITSAQEDGSSSSTPPTRPALTQACVLAMSGLEDTYLTHFDVFSAAQKTALQARSTALKAAAAVADDAQRQAAVKKANDDFIAASKAAWQTSAVDMQTAMTSVTTACGNVRGWKGLDGLGLGIGPMMGDGMMRGPEGRPEGGSGSMMGERGMMRGLHLGQDDANHQPNTGSGRWMMRQNFRLERHAGSSSSASTK